MLAPETPTLPSLKLLKGLIKDQNDRSPYQTSQNSTYITSTVGTYPPTSSNFRNRNI